MTQSMTIVLGDDLVKKLKDIQAKLVKESEKSVRFSHVLNELVRKSLEHKS